MQHLKYILLVLSVFCVHILFAQNIETDSTGYTKIYYGNGQVSSEGYLVDGKPDGYWKTYYVNGMKKSEGNRKLFQLDSVWLFYDEGGDTLEIINYNLGKKNGYYYKFQYEYEKTDADSVKVGWLASKELYLNNQKAGQAYYYYKNGSLHQIIYHENNKRHGPGKEYSKEGRLISILEFHNDYQIRKDRINRYDHKEQKKGKWVEFYPNETMHIEANYKEDKLHGYYREYDEKGNIIKLERYENGVLVEENAQMEADSLQIVFRNEY